MPAPAGWDTGGLPGTGDDLARIQHQANVDIADCSLGHALNGVDPIDQSGIGHRSVGRLLIARSRSAALGSE
jgi:hypothetical protein